jgi:predicted phosphoribosyltransferase
MVAQMTKMLKQLERYANLRAAGRALSARLDVFAQSPDLVVLGIALGGVPVAREVATALNAPLDIILLRRLLSGDDATSVLCAVNVAGKTILDDGITLPDTPGTPIEYFLTDAVEGLTRRERACRRGRDKMDIDGKTVLVIDCGIRTGSTMKTALRAVGKLNPKRVIAAVPVTSIEGAKEISGMCDQLICLEQPAIFVNAAYWYGDFSRPGDAEVGDLLGQ